MSEAKAAIQARIQTELRKNSHVREIGQVKDLRDRLTRRLSDLKSAKWVLVHRPDDLRVDKQEQLKRLKPGHELLAALCPIADLIRRIWRCPSEKRTREELQKARSQLLAITEKHDFKTARRFAGMLSRREEGIVYTGQF